MHVSEELRPGATIVGHPTTSAATNQHHPAPGASPKWITKQLKRPLSYAAEVAPSPSPGWGCPTPVPQVPKERSDDAILAILDQLVTTKATTCEIKQPSASDGNPYGTSSRQQQQDGTGADSAHDASYQFPDGWKGNSTITQNRTASKDQGLAPGTQGREFAVKQCPRKSNHPGEASCVLDNWATNQMDGQMTTCSTRHDSGSNDEGRTSCIGQQAALDRWMGANGGFDVDVDQLEGNTLEQAGYQRAAGLQVDSKGRVPMQVWVGPRRLHPLKQSSHPVPQSGYIFQPPTSSSGAVRHCEIPTAFSSLESYLEKLVQSMREEISLKLTELASTFFAATSQVAATAQGHSMPSMSVQPGRQNAAGLASLVSQACEHTGLKYFPHSKLTTMMSMRKKRALEDQPPCGSLPGKELPCKRGFMTFLTLQGPLNRKQFRKHDLWIVSNHPCLQNPPPGAVGDKLAQPWVHVCRSLWHGPDRDGRFEVEFLGAGPPRGKQCQDVFALKGPDCATDLDLVDFLENAEFKQVPILQHFVQPPNGLTLVSSKSPTVAGTSSQLAGEDNPTNVGALTLPAPGSLPIVEDPEVVSCVQACSLNPEQALVARHVASWLKQLISDKQQTVVPGAWVQRERRKENSVAFSAPQSGQPADGPLVPGSGASPVCLVHGPFGSGKSTLLVALLQLLRGRFCGEPAAEEQGGLAPCQSTASTLLPTEAPVLEKDNNMPEGASPHGPSLPTDRAHIQQPEHEMAEAPAQTLAARNHGRVPRGKKLGRSAQLYLPRPRILVAAHTNVALDRVMKGLLESGYTDFLRLGSLQRMCRSLLPYSLHVGEDNRDATAQLKDMLKSSTSVADTLAIKAELECLQRGAERQRRQRLGTAGVVGVTCCSALLPTLAGQIFDVVVLDEVSQLTEPLSLVPIIRARAKAVILAGDPLQLGPVLTAPSQVSMMGEGSPAGQPAGQTSFTQCQGLMRSLFVRLQDLGHPCHLLRRQYRCHPALSLTSNRCFYNMQLQDGVSAACRHPLLAGLPPLLCCDITGAISTVDLRTKSRCNKQEANLVSQAVKVLLKNGLQGTQIGVICFYRAQVALIQQLLTRQCNQQGQEGPCDNSSVPEPPPLIDQVQVATVDSFQGAEKDMVILATTCHTRSDFCSDTLRLNVALTRARHHMLVLGCLDQLVLSSPAFKCIRELSQGPSGKFCSYTTLLPLLASCGQSPGTELHA